MFKSFSISRLTATQRSSLEQAFHWHPTLLSELRRRAVSASYLSSHIPARRRGLPVIVDSMSKPYSGRPLCVAVKRLIHNPSRRCLIGAGCFLADRLNPLDLFVQLGQLDK